MYGRKNSFCDTCISDCHSSVVETTFQGTSYDGERWMVFDQHDYNNTDEKTIFVYRFDSYIKTEYVQINFVKYDIRDSIIKVRGIQRIAK